MRAAEAEMQIQGPVQVNQVIQFSEPQIAHVAHGQAAIERLCLFLKSIQSQIPSNSDSVIHLVAFRCSRFQCDGLNGAPVEP